MLAGGKLVVLAFDLSTCLIQHGFGAGEISRLCGHAMEDVCHTDRREVFPPFTPDIVLLFCLLYSHLCALTKYN